MERIQSINPKRIAWCCADYGISPDELAEQLSISGDAMGRVMSHGAGLTFNQLSKIAEYFNRGVLFFLEEGSVDETQLHTPQFRTLANDKINLTNKLKALIERVERQRDVYLSLREDIESPEQQYYDAPNIPTGDPRTAAQIARKWLGLGETNDFETYRAAVESKGILVFRSNGYSGKWQIEKSNPMLGFTLYDPKCPVIVVKKQSWPTRHTFTLMHELGHLLLHKSSTIDDENDMYSYQGRERESNEFAGHLLVPDTFLDRIKDSDRPKDVSQYDDWLEEQRKTWGVSGEVILRRLLDVNRLTKVQYEYYRKWRANVPVAVKEGGNRAYRYREPKHVFGDTYVRTVLDALNTRRITLTKASSYLDNLKIKDLHELEKFYAGV